MLTTRLRAFSLAAAVVLAAGVPQSRAADQVALEISKIFFEYNSSANDLGVQVMLDGEDWKKLKIVNPKDKAIFAVEGKGPYKTLGLTELFFEGAEPTLTEFPLDDLLALFPEGAYEFKGKTVDGATIRGTGTLSHAIPAGPVVSTAVGPGNSVVISWTAVTSTPVGFPVRPINIVGYQVIVGENFQVTVPSGTHMVTVSPEFVASLPPGPQPFEVLAIDTSANQTITEGSFVKP